MTVTTVEPKRYLRCAGCNKLLAQASCDGRTALSVVCPRCRRFNLFYVSSDLGVFGAA